ncbi:MAG TPA: flagellar filament capping protein FliD [Atribacteraceae bacterium]|nr:flagellar filament capping protein FliD [Atribacteraceae bacterium]
MGIMTIDGLVSGLDTSDIIKKLMEIERAPITRMENDKTVNEAKIEILQDLNTRLLTLKSYADNLKTPSFFQSKSAVSSQSSVLGAEAGTTAQPGRHALTVERLALAHQVAAHNGIGQGYASKTAPAFGTGTITLQMGQTTRTITITAANNTLEGIRDAVNRTGLALSATVVSTETGFSLLVMSRETGVAGEVAFTVDLTGFTPGYELAFRNIQPAQNARVLLGTVNPLVYEGNSNRITDLIPGVTIDLKTTSAVPVMLDVTVDTSLVEENIRGFISNYNEVLDTIKQLTRYNPETRDQGVFLGNFVVSNLRHQLERVVSGIVASAPPETNSLPMIGIRLSREGRLQLEDPEKLRTALTDNLNGVRSLFTGGIATDLSDTLRNLTTSNGGVLWLERDRFQQRLTQIDRRIQSMEHVLALRETRLRRQFTRLEEVLGDLQAQGNWLTQQIQRMQTGAAGG